MLSAPVAAELYKWTDADGTHYGDRPPNPGPTVERLVIDECTTDACARELERRREDTQAAYRELQAWLDRRAAERAAAQQSARIEYRPVPVYIPGPLTVFPYTPVVTPGHHHRLRAHKVHRPVHHLQHP